MLGPGRTRQGDAPGHIAQQGQQILAGADDGVLRRKTERLPAARGRQGLQPVAGEMEDQALRPIQPGEPRRPRPCQYRHRRAAQRLPDALRAFGDPLRASRQDDDHRHGRFADRDRHARSSTGAARLDLNHTDPAMIVRGVTHPILERIAGSMAGSCGRTSTRYVRQSPHARSLSLQDGTNAEAAKEKSQIFYKMLFIL